MSMYFRLIRHLIGASIGRATLRYDRRNGKKVGGRMVLYAFVMLYVMGIFMFMTGGFAFALFAGNPEAPVAVMGLTLMIVVAQLGGVFLELRSIGGTLGWSKDSPLLFSLPLRKSTVFLARLTMTVGGSLFIQFILLGPVLFFYLGWAGWSLAAIIKALLVLACAPLLPTLIASILSMVFMRVSAFSRHRDLMLTILGIASIVIIVPLSQWLTSGLVSSLDENALAALLTDPSGLVSAISSAWPPAGWAATGLAYGGWAGWGPMLLYLGFSLAAVTVTTLIGAWLYQRGAVAQNESSSRKRRRSLKIASSSAFSALVKREWKLLLRSPTYAINGLAGVLMGPLFLMMSLFAQNELGELSQLVPVEFMGTLAVGITLFIACVNMVPSTSLSREGRMLWILKMLPISAKDIVRAKLVAGYQAGILGSLVSLVLMGIVFKLSVGTCLLAGLIMLIANLAMTGVFLLIDLSRPRLIWENENAAMKQNMNGVIAMAVGLGMSIVFMLPIVLLPVGWGYAGSALLAAIGAVVVLGALNAMAEPLIRRAGSAS